MERVILTTGGTGGHIFPALAVAEEIRRRYPRAMLLFMGGKFGMEADIAVNAGLDFVGLPVRGVMGRGLRGAGAAFGMARAVGAAMGHIRKMKPQLVVGFGGYAAFAGVLAARLSGVKTAVHEQNAFPGMTNKMLGRVVNRVFLSMPDRSGSFDPAKCLLVGNPVRAGFVELYERGLEGPAMHKAGPETETPQGKSWYGGVDAPSPFSNTPVTTGPVPASPDTADAPCAGQAGHGAASPAEPGSPGSVPAASEGQRADLSQRPPRLLVVGGSQGAKALNDGMIASAAALLEAEVEIWHQTGQADYERVRKAYREAKAEHVRVEPFIVDMPKACAWADLFFGRAGASSIAELTSAGLPALFAPFPHAAQNHQLQNARYLEEEGAASVLEQKDFTPPSGKSDRLVEALLSLLCDNDRLQAMALKSLTLAKPYAARDLVDSLETLLTGAGN